MDAIPKRLSPIAAFLLGAVLFAALATGTSLLLRATALDGPAARQLVLKSAMIVVSVALMALIARPLRDWGFTLPREWLRTTLLPIVAGGALGAASTAIIIGFRFEPMAGMRELGLVRLVAIVWFGSTIAEELFVRGLVQGWMQPTGISDAAHHKPGSTARILSSGLLFGGFHVTLLLAGNDLRTATTIIVATAGLGLVCAWSRERSGSLLGPVLAHFSFNACGLVGGVAVLIITKILGN